MAGIGKYLRNLRQSHDFSMDQVAVLVNIPPPKIQQIEREEILPSPYQLYKIAGLFRVDAHQLMINYQEELITNSPSDRIEVLERRLNDWQRTRYNVKIIPVLDVLTDYIESIVYYENYNHPYPYAGVLPDGMPQLIIDLNPPSQLKVEVSFGDSSIYLHPYLLLGQRETPFYLPLAQNERKVIIRFRPNGLFMLSGIRQDHLLNKMVEAEYIFGNKIKQLHEELLHQSDTNEFSSLITRFFVDIIKKNKRNIVEANVVQFLIANIEQPISLLVQKSGYSQKHLIHIFRTYTGLTPKKLQQIYQFSNVINDLPLIANHHLAGVAYDHDYFDQAHFTRQFTRFSGFTPINYLKTGNICSRMVLLQRG